LYHSRVIKKKKKTCLLSLSRSNGSATTVQGLGFRVFKAHRLLYHSTLGSRVIKKRKQEGGHLLPLALEWLRDDAREESADRQGLGFRV